MNPKPETDLENISYEIADRLADGALDSENAPKIYKYDFDKAVLRIGDDEIPVTAVSRTGYRAENVPESSALRQDAELLLKLKLQYRIQGENDDDAWKDVEEDGNGDCYFDAGAGSRKGLDLSNAEILTAEHPLSDIGIGLQKSDNMSWEYKFVQKLYYTSRYDTNKDRTENNQILVHTLKSDYRAVAEWGDNGDKYGTRPELDHFPEGMVLTRTLDQKTEEAAVDTASNTAAFEDGMQVTVSCERTEAGEDVITLPDAPGFDVNNHPYVYTLNSRNSRRRIC